MFLPWIAAVLLSASPGATVFDGYYDPANLTIKKGQTIRWTFDKSNTQSHTVTYLSGPPKSKYFSSGSIGAGGSYRKKLTIKGRYTLYCVSHPNMIEKIRVR